MECGHKIQLKSGLIVPCGKCPICKANDRQEWVFRLTQESLNCAFSVFVTLTYDETHLPKDLSVNKRDIQLFHKRLRKHFPSNELRFYLVSEYGDNTHRPHYHGLYFFNSKQDIKSIYDIFVNSWNNGFIKFGLVEEGSIVYCTKYCLKGSDVPPGRKQNFRLVSKMSGGIGYNYLEQMSSFHIDNDVYSYVAYAGKRCRMPKYYKDKLYLTCKTLNPEFVQSQLEVNGKRINVRVRTQFKEFLQTHRGFANMDEAVNAFELYQRKRVENQDELIIKHCKKQKI